MYIVYPPWQLTEDPHGFPHICGALESVNGRYDIPFDPQILEDIRNRRLLTAPTATGCQFWTGTYRYRGRDPYYMPVARNVRFAAAYTREKPQTPTRVIILAHHLDLLHLHMPAAMRLVPSCFDRTCVSLAHTIPRGAAIQGFKLDHDYTSGVAPDNVPDIIGPIDPELKRATEDLKRRLEQGANSKPKPRKATDFLRMAYPNDAVPSEDEKED